MPVSQFYSLQVMVHPLLVFRRSTAPKWTITRLSYFRNRSGLLLDEFKNWLILRCGWNHGNAIVRKARPDRRMILLMHTPLLHTYRENVPRVRRWMLPKGAGRHWYCRPWRLWWQNLIHPDNRPFQPLRGNPGKCTMSISDAIMSLKILD